MKIKLLGTGALKAKEMSACALIDNVILFDCPNGLHKKLVREDFNIESLEGVIISHYHGDHDFDMPFLLKHLAESNRPEEKPFTIVAPKGAEERYRKLCEMANYTSVFEKIQPTFIEVDCKTKEVAIGDYVIKPYKVKHDNLEAFGYTILRNNCTVGFTGDSVLCDGVKKIMQESNIVIMDVTGPPPLGQPPMHMDVSEFEQLKAKFPDCEIIPIHMNDDTRKKLKKLGHKPPSDNQEFKIKPPK